MFETLYDVNHINFSDHHTKLQDVQIIVPLMSRKRLFYVKLDIEIPKTYGFLDDHYSLYDHKHSVARIRRLELPIHTRYRVNTSPYSKTKHPMFYSHRSCKDTERTFCPIRTTDLASLDHVLSRAILTAPYTVRDTASTFFSALVGAGMITASNVEGWELFSVAYKDNWPMFKINNIHEPVPAHYTTLEVAVKDLCNID